MSLKILKTILKEAVRPLFLPYFMYCYVFPSKTERNEKWLEMRLEAFPLNGSSSYIKSPVRVLAQIGNVELANVCAASLPQPSNLPHSQKTLIPA